MKNEAKSGADYIDEYREKSGLPSDRKVAERLGVTRQAISLIRHGGGIDDLTAIELAEGIEESPLTIIASIKSKTARSEKVRKFWRGVLTMTFKIKTKYGDKNR